MHYQADFAEPTAADLLIQIAEMRGMIQGHLIRQDARATTPATTEARP